MPPDEQRRPSQTGATQKTLARVSDPRLPRCPICTTPFEMGNVGRPKKYCKPACREAAARRRKRQPAYLTSKTDEWETPQELFDRLDERHGPFTLDVCATPGNAKCDRFFTRADNALMHPWEGVCWMNPPYGRDIGLWVAKAYDTARVGHTVVCLLPARTDTIWWQRFVLPHAQVEFIKGRVRFGGKDMAPFPSAAATFHCAFHCAPGNNETGNESGAQ
jgi:phage N-6-adenine-methyltransferase